MRLPSLHIPRISLRAPKEAPAAAASAAAAPSAAKTAPTAAAVPTAAAAPATAAATTPTTTSASSLNLIGAGAGALGLLTTGLNLYQDTKSDIGLSSSSAFGPSTVALGAGAAALALSGSRTGALSTVLRGTGATLLVSGLLSAVHGAYERFNFDERRAEPASTQVQEPAKFGVDLPAAAPDLAGIRIGVATVPTSTDKGARGQARVDVYVDPATAKTLPATTPLGDAIAQARALSQGDPTNRAHAVLQARDGSRIIAPLAGDLDQIDGRFYGEGNDFEAALPPVITKRHPSLQAIAGVEKHYTFPAGTDPDEPVQDPGAIPWVTPKLPEPKKAATP